MLLLADILGLQPEAIDVYLSSQYWIGLISVLTILSSVLAVLLLLLLIWLMKRYISKRCRKASKKSNTHATSDTRGRLNIWWTAGCCGGTVNEDKSAPSAAVEIGQLPAAKD